MNLTKFFQFSETDSRVVSYLTHNFLDTVKIFELKTGKQVLPRCDAELLHKICGIIETNALIIPLPNGMEVSAIYPTFSLLEHSCVSNCSYSFKLNDGFRISVKAATNIKKGLNLY